MTTLAILFSGTQEEAPTDLFESLYARSLGARAAIDSVAAEFTETTVSSLLVEPLIARGTLVAAEPGNIVMEYVTGERRKIVIVDDRLVVVWPERPSHEVRTIRTTRERVSRYFRDASTTDLRRLFAITASVDPEHPDTYRVAMSPRRDEIREGLTSLQLWVSQESILMERLFMEFPNGDSKLIELQNMRLNVPVDETTFAIPDEPKGPR